MKIGNTLRYLFFYGFALAVLGCSKNNPKADKPDQDAVAYINEEPILASEIEAEVLRQGLPLASIDSWQRAYESIVKRSLLLAAAKRDGIEESPEFLRDKNALLIRHWKKKYWGSVEPTTISEEAMLAHYTEQPDQFYQPGQKRYAIIFKKNANKNQDNSSALRRFIQAIEAYKIKSNDDEHFGALALEYSDLPRSRYRGGDTAWLLDEQQLPDDLPPEFNRAAKALENIGDYSKIIETKQGFGVVKLIGLKESTVLPFEKVKGHLARQLRTAAYEEAELRRWERLESRLGLKENPDVLEKAIHRANRRETDRADQPPIPF